MCLECCDDVSIPLRWSNSIANGWIPFGFGFVPALAKAGLAGKGITIHGLRSAAISLYAARGLSMLETATIMGQADPGVTWKHYARLFDRSDVEARVRAAQASLGAPLEKDSGGDF